MNRVICGSGRDRDFRNMMNAFTDSIFGFTFERWHEFGMWDERYECYSVIESGHIISNASVAKMDLLVKGKRIPTIQIGAVATLPEHRGKGLARRIMEHILGIYPTTPAFLFANGSVLDFYPKFGFQRVIEVQPYIKLESPLQGGTCVRMAVDDPVLARHIASRHQFSMVVDIANADYVNWFHIIMEFGDSIYHIPQYDVIVIGTQRGNTVMLYDVIMGDVGVGINDILPYLPFKGADTIEFAFTPDFLCSDYLIKKHVRLDSLGYLFCRGVNLKGGFKLPYMAMT